MTTLSSSFVTIEKKCLKIIAKVFVNRKGMFVTLQHEKDLLLHKTSTVPSSGSSDRKRRKVYQHKEMSNLTLGDK
jgi:hypothetical protein